MESWNEHLESSRHSFLFSVSIRTRLNWNQFYLFLYFFFLTLNLANEKTPLFRNVQIIRNKNRARKEVFLGTIAKTPKVSVLVSLGRILGSTSTRCSCKKERGLRPDATGATVCQLTSQHWLFSQTQDGFLQLIFMKLLSLPFGLCVLVLICEKR